MEKTILIAGGTGYMRRYIVDALLSDPENVVASVDLLTPAGTHGPNECARDEPRYRHYRVNVENTGEITRLLAGCRPRAIINLSGEGDVRHCEVETPVPTPANIIATFHLLEAARLTWRGNDQTAGPYRFVQVSTTNALESKATDPFTSIRLVGDASRRPRPYDEIVASRLVERWWRSYDLPAINVHAMNTFGPFQACDHFVPRTIEALLGQRAVRPRRDQRDWVFVEDAADAIVFLSQRGMPGIHYGVDSADSRQSEFQIAELICDQLDQLMPRVRGTYAEFLDVSDASGNSEPVDESRIRRLRNELGWKPLNDFHCALAATVRWHLDQATWWEQRPLIRAEDERHAALG